MASVRRIEGFAIVSEDGMLADARERIDQGDLVRILPDWELPEGLLHLVFTSRRCLLPGVRAMIDFAAEVLKPGAPGWESVV